MKILSCLILFLLSFSFVGFGQTPTPDDMDTLAPKLLAKKGTYEVIIADTLSPEPPLSVTDDFLREIEAQRHPFDYVIWVVTPNISINIFPKQVAIQEENE